MKKITLIPGDGIGIEVVNSTKRIIDSVVKNIAWDVQNINFNMNGSNGNPSVDNIIKSIHETGIALKGPITTPVGYGFRSINVLLRMEFDLFANVRPIKTIDGIVTRFSDINIDLIIVRENTEDLYQGIEHMVGDDAAESIKIFTRKGCERISKFAFEYAKTNLRKKVTVVHKANIMKCTDGMFLDVARQTAKMYPDIEFEDKIIDALCMNLVQIPDKFDVLLLPNLYGDIVSDLCAGLVGGLGIASGSNLGTKYAIFEPVHGSAPDIAGKNIANPLAMIETAVHMLNYIGENEAAKKIQNSINFVIQEGKVRTSDLNGKVGTKEFTDYIINNIIYNS